MFDVYLLTRIGVIHGVFVAATMISLLTALCSFIYSITTDDYTGESVCNDVQNQKLRKFSKKCLIVFCVSLPLAVITPAQEQALMIYGVGGTLDYIKSNDKAKQLPDKVIDALDEWLTKQTQKEND